MAKLHATLENSKGKTVSLSDNNEIIATVYDGNLKAYSVIIEWTNLGDLEEPTIGAIITTREWRNQPDDRQKSHKHNSTDCELSDCVICNLTVRRCELNTNLYCKNCIPKDN